MTSNDITIPEYPFDFKDIPLDQRGGYIKQLFKVRCSYMPRLLAHIPLPAQFKFHVSPAIERLASGGNQSGKTYSAAWDYSIHAHRVYPDWYPTYNQWVYEKPLKMRIVGGNITENIENIMVPMITWWLEDSNPVSWRRRHGHIIGGETKDGRAMFYCVSEKQGLKAHEGWTGHYVYIDEPLGEQFYNANLRGIEKYEGKIVMAQTPLPDLVESEWIDKQFPLQNEIPTNPKEPCRIQLITTDNLFLSQERRDHFAERMKNSSPEEYATRVQGFSPGMMRQVLKEFNPKHHVIPTTSLDFATYYFALDPHPVKGEAMAWMAVRPPKEGHTPAKILVYDHFDASTFMTYGNLVKLIQKIEMERNYKPIARCVDRRFCQSKNKETGHNFLYEFQRVSRELDYPMYITPALAGDIEFGNNRIRQMLVNTTFDLQGDKWVEVPELRIMDTCEVTIPAMFKYIYNRQGKKVEDNKFKDPIDVLRYLMTMTLEYRTPINPLMATDNPQDDDSLGVVIPFQAL